MKPFVIYVVQTLQLRERGKVKEPNVNGRHRPKYNWTQIHIFTRSAETPPVNKSQLVRRRQKI